MPPLECANFLECENKTVCVAPFDLPMNPTPVFSIIYQKIITFHPAELFFSFFFFFFGQNCLECDSMCNYRRLTKNLYLSHIPENVIPGDFSKKKNEKKKEKKTKKTKNYRVRRFYGVRRSCRVRGFYSMCASLAVECDVPCGVRRICGMRRIPSMRGWYRDHIGKFRGQNQNSNPKAGPNFQGHTSGFYFSKFTLGEVPGKKLANFYLANL